MNKMLIFGLLMIGWGIGFIMNSVVDSISFQSTILNIEKSCRDSSSVTIIGEHAYICVPVETILGKRQGPTA